MSYYEPKIHHRRSMRLDNYDYSQEGLYFVTCCCQDREYFFGEITGEEMIFNEAGKMIAQEWVNLTDRFVQIRLHKFIIIPNHFHGIVEIVGATLVVAQNLAIAQIRKRATTRDCPNDCPFPLLGNCLFLLKKKIKVI